MTETVLASLDAPTNEADSGTSTSDAGGHEGGVPGAAGAGADSTRGPDSGAAANGKEAADSSASADSAGANNKLVPLAALHESREHIRQLKAQIDELKAQPKLSAEDAELLKSLKAQHKAASEPKDPEFLEDPKGYIDAKEKRVAKALEELKDGEKQRKEAEQAQAQFQTLVTTIAAHETTFIASNPDYHEALSHMRNVRSQQLKMLFPQATDAQINAQIGREEISAANQIVQAGGNPCDFAYNYAKTLGYTKKAAEAAVANGGVAAAAAAATGNGAEKPDKDAVRTLGGGGGAEGEGAPEDPMPEFTQALKERFTRKRK